MKVFISWSGDTSYQVAVALREWLPLVVPSAKPYVSAEDIDKGARWSSEVWTELAFSKFGVLCVTKENASEPWINFEAGALSKALDKNRVCPFLLGLVPTDLDRRSPLLQFQAATMGEDGAWRLVQSISKSAEAAQEKSILEKQFRRWWPEFHAEVERILASRDVGSPAPSKPRIEIMMEELLEIARERERRDSLPPQNAFPPGGSTPRILYAEADTGIDGNKVNTFIATIARQGARWIDTSNSADSDRYRIFWHDGPSEEEAIEWARTGLGRSVRVSTRPASRPTSADTAPAG
jgi:hypothetical protein